MTDQPAPTSDPRTRSTARSSGRRGRHPRAAPPRRRGPAPRRDLRPPASALPLPAGRIEPDETPLWSVTAGLGLEVLAPPEPLVSPEPETTEPVPEQASAAVALEEPASPVDVAEIPTTVTATPERRRTRWGAGLAVALFTYYLLCFMAAAANWWDAPVRPTTLRQPIAGYALAALLVMVAGLVRGRWKALPIVLATAVGVALPIWLVRSLITAVGPRAVWTGQGLTVSVLLPLVVGTAAAVSFARAPRSRRRAGAVDAAVADSPI